MNNLHRELAPISDSAWAEIEEETSRTLKRYLAGRRVVDVQGPGGTFLSAVGTGHLVSIPAPGDGIVARQREVKPLVELRVPFELDRQQIDDVDRGANDSDWQPAKGRRATDRLCRGWRHIRGLRRCWHSGPAPGDQQPHHDPPRRRARVPGSHCPGLEPVASGWRQRPLLGAAWRRRLHRTRRDQRPRLPGARARQAAGQR